MNVIKPTDPFPEITFNLLAGGTTQLSDKQGNWQMLIVYRGDHCPRCKHYMQSLHQLAPDFAQRNVEILVASMDPERIASRTVDENSWTLPVAHSMSTDECRRLSLYLTPHTPDSELEGPYSEPGLFLINPQGQTQVIAISNSPSVRPDLAVVLDGIIGTQERNLPIRGTYT